MVVLVIFGGLPILEASDVDAEWARTFRIAILDRLMRFVIAAGDIFSPMVKLVVRMVDFISQVSGFTSALYRHEVSHTNCTTDRFQPVGQLCQRCQQRSCKLACKPGSVIRHISCNAV